MDEQRLQEVLEDLGFAVVPRILDRERCSEVESLVGCAASPSPGSRDLLEQAWCQSLAADLRDQPSLAPLLEGSVAIQCTYFDKNPGANWLVPIHQDLSIPVKRVASSNELSGWSTKQRQTFVQAPVRVLERLIAVRVHLDDNGSENGPLCVVPRSHKLGRIAAGQCYVPRRSYGEVECHVVRGDALVMRPLILHSSSKAKGTHRRRVLHFVFGPPELPYGLEWAQLA